MFENYLYVTPEGGPIHETLSGKKRTICIL
jgi:hypothetical protein